MLTAQVEPFAPFLDEVKPMLPLHWDELALNKDKVPLDPDFDEYLRRDAAGAVVAVTLRQMGGLVGYVVAFITPGLHYRTCLTMAMDIYWTHPDVRGGMGGMRLWREAIREAKRRGVHRIVAASKNHKDSSRLFKALGFEPIESVHALWVGG